MLTFLAARRARHFVAAVVLLGALTAWRGMVDAPVPAAVEDGQAAIPLWRLLTMGAAVLPVLALHSELSTLEEMATYRYRRTERIYLATMSAGFAVAFLGIATLSLPASTLLIMARSWLAWTGLALLAGAVLGWRLAWTAPAGVAVTLAYWGLSDGRYVWWEFSARPPDDLASLVLSVVLLAAGLAAYWITPWRWRKLFPIRRGEPSRSLRR